MFGFGRRKTPVRDVMYRGELVSPGYAIGSSILHLSASRRADDYLFERFPSAFGGVTDFIALLTDRDPLLAFLRHDGLSSTEAQVGRMAEYTRDVRIDAHLGHPLVPVSTTGGDAVGWRCMRTAVFLSQAIEVKPIGFSEKSERDAGDSLILSGAAAGVVEAWDSYPITGKESDAVLLALCQAAVSLASLWMKCPERSLLSTEVHPDSAD